MIVLWWYLQKQVQPYHNTCYISCVTNAPNWITLKFSYFLRPRCYFCYRPPTDLWKGVFSRVCPLVILTRGEALPCDHYLWFLGPHHTWTSSPLYSPPPQKIIFQTWTCSNMFNLDLTIQGPPPLPPACSNFSLCSTDCLKADGWHSTEMPSYFQCQIM